ncbi:zinc-dependent metalloprotease [Glaciecola petra]
MLVFVPFTQTFANNQGNDDFLQDKSVQNGLLDIVYDKNQDKVFLRLKSTQIEQLFIFKSSLPQGIGSNDIGLDRGQLADTRLVKFQRFGNKILLKQLNTKYRATSDNIAERKSVDEAFADSVIAGFELAHEEEDKLYIDYTNFLQTDIHGIGERLSRSGQGGYSIDKGRSGVYLAKTKTFEKNTELESLITFAGSPKGQYIRDVSPDAKSVTVHLHHSFIQLPDSDYRPRSFHPYSGFWKHSYIDYSVPIDEAMEQKFIPRHRLAKQDPNAAISEAVEPIVYYLDPGIPEPVMSALKEGALWWDQAFEAAGYKNAFQVKVLPEGADPMDVRYNVIQWVHRATRGWSYGSSVIDPRTGEIIKGHVTLGSLRVRQDFLIANAFTSPFVDSETEDTQAQMQLALNRIRQLSAHEVGHTIGIAHNFAASENNRASVMDYPHPYISLEAGKINLAEAYDLGIGEWDKYVVKYGYQDYPDSIDEQNALMELVEQTQAAGFLYKSDPDARITKRASADGHLWDNGSKPVTEFERFIKVRAHALNKFGENSLPKNSNYSDLERRLVPLYYSHRYQLDALVKQVSGLHYQYSVKGIGQAPNVIAVDADIQQQALKLLVSSASAEFLTLSNDILKLIPPKAYGSTRTRESMPSRMDTAFDPITAAESISGYTLNILLQSERLNRLAFQHSQNSDIPSVKQVSNHIFSELIETNSISPLEQRIQKVALSVFFDVLSDEELSAEAKMSMYEVLIDFEKWLQKNSKRTRNKVMLKHLKQYWATGIWALNINIKPLPPGSPI